MTFATVARRLAALLFVVTACVVVMLPESGHTASRTEKTFGSWLATCVDNDQGARRCTIAQQLVSKTTRRPVFTVSVSGTTKAEQTVTIAIPTGVSLPDGVTLGVGDQAPVAFVYSMCGPRICVATTTLDAKLLASLKGQPKALANYVRANKKLVQINVDLAGFSDAYAFLVSQVP